MRGDLNLGISEVADILARLLGCILCLCKCVAGEAVCVHVCGGPALMRSPKNTSLAVKGVRSHCVFPLIHTGLARTVPVVKSTWLGNTKLRHQLPGSHYIGQGRTELNWITLSQSHVGICAFAHARALANTLTLRKQSVIHSSGTLSRQGTVFTAHHWDSLSVRNRSASYDWLTHTSIWLLNRLICTVNSGLVPFPSPMGAGDNLTFIEIQLQWVQGGWRSFFYCHRWDGGRARHQTLKALSLSDALLSANGGIFQESRVNFVVHPNMVNNSV